MRGIDLHRIAKDAGVRLYESDKHSAKTKKPRDCFCKPTLRRIAEKHGPAHLRLVLRLMTGTRANSSALYSDVIKAVSEIIARHPGIERRSSMTADFDRLDLPEMRARARRMQAPCAASGVLFTMIALKLGVMDQIDMFEDAA